MRRLAVVLAAALLACSPLAPRAGDAAPGREAPPIAARREPGSPAPPASPPARGPVVLFDLVHAVRHSPHNVLDRGDVLYNELHGYGSLVRLLERRGCAVRYHESGRLAAAALQGVDVLFLGLMSDEALPLTEAERDAIDAFVRGGGGLLAIADHTNVYGSADLANPLLERFGVRVADVMIVDPTAPKPSYAPIEDFSPHPVTRGLRLLVPMAPGALDTAHGVGQSGPLSWGDVGDPRNGVGRYGDERRGPDEPAGPQVFLAAAEAGRGRVVVVADANTFGNTCLHAWDHRRLALNAVAWLAGLPALPAARPAPPRLFVHEHDPALFRGHVLTSGFYELLTCLARIGDVDVGLGPALDLEADALLLFASAATDARAGVVRGYVAGGGSLVLAVDDVAAAAAFLEPLGVRLGYRPERACREEYWEHSPAVAGHPAFVRNAHHLPWIVDVTVEGAEPLVTGTPGGPAAAKVYLARRRVGAGRVLVLTSAELLTGGRLGHPLREPSRLREQLRWFVEDLAREAVR